MELHYQILGDSDQKPNLESRKHICRCCLSTEKNMQHITLFATDFIELSAINVSESDGLPSWLCWECQALLRKAVRFKRKLLKAHHVLYDYLTRCAPFAIDAQDDELTKYTSPELNVTSTLVHDNTGKPKMGFHTILQHEKNMHKTELDAIELPVDIDKKEDNIVKDEAGFSDYEDNITLEEYRCNVNNVDDKNFDKLENNEDNLLEEYKKIKKKKKTKNKENKVKNKKSSKAENVEVAPREGRSSIRKPIELDPSKIRVIVLNPEEQIKQREEESKVGLKFPFMCNLCFKGFNFEAKLQNHMAKHSPSRGSFECRLCSMYLPTAYSYSVHSLIHTRRYECVQCGRRMTDRASIQDHYRTQHEGLMTLYTCSLCGKVSNNNKTHRGHLRNHHAGARPRCHLCDRSFVNKDSLAEHLQIHLGIKNYECAVCGARFRTRTQIKHHQLKHSDLKEFYCVECDVRFKSAHNLRQHLQKSLKHKDRQSFKYACPSCPLRFECSTRLARHRRVQHEGVREYRCGVCGAALASRGSLIKHQRAVHAGLRPQPRHVCDTCGKAFRGKSVLTNHVRTHTGEKPFACTVCGRAFSQRTAMRTHHNLVHLKLRRNKVKPEAAAEVKPCLEELPPVPYPWARNASSAATSQPPVATSQPPATAPAEVYFTVTAGP